MSEIINTAVVLASTGMTGPVLDTGCRFIESLLGETCKIAGAMLGDQMYNWQWKNRIKIANKAVARLQANAVAAKVLPSGFLLPLLEAAGNSEDEGLQEIWARLLAGAVVDETYQHVGLVYALKELAPVDARVLDTIINNEPGTLTRDEGLDKLAGMLKISRQTAAMSVANLRRVGLMSITGANPSEFAFELAKACVSDPSVVESHREKLKKMPHKLLSGQ